MRARRVVSLVILAAFVAIAVFAFLGDVLLASVFVVIEAAVLGHHAVSLCARCSNAACGFHKACGDGLDPARLDGGPYSNLPITRSTVVPLLLSYPLAVIAAWRFSPIATVAVGAVGLGAHQVFRELACRHCGNDCLGNCNPRYKEWRAAQRETAW